jgi:hypothetical protein
MTTLNEYLNSIDQDGWESWIEEAEKYIDIWQDEYESNLRDFYSEGLSPLKAVRRLRELYEH